MDDSPRSPASTLDADEAAMRRSLGLDRGSMLRAPGAGSPQGGQSSGPRPGQIQAGQARARHRFRQDGEVQVEIAETARSSGRPGAGNGNGHHTELEQLRTALQQERTAREQAEHALQHARESLRTLQTQVAHADMANREAIATAQRARDAAEHALEDMREKLMAAEAAQIRPRSRQQTADAGSAPGEIKDVAQPVQWWLPGWKGRGG